MRHLLIYQNTNKQLRVFPGSYTACLLQANILLPSEFIILSPEGDIRDSRLKSLAFLHKIFLFDGDNNYES